MKRSIKFPFSVPSNNLSYLRSSERQIKKISELSFPYRFDGIDLNGFDMSLYLAFAFFLDNLSFFMSMGELSINIPIVGIYFE